MSLRISDPLAAVRHARGAALIGLLLLAACGQKQDEPAPGLAKVECRLSGAKDFAELCTTEKMGSPEGRVIVARAPDGSFRRFLVVSDGRGVVAADGAEPVTVTPAGKDHIDVAAGDMVWRLPAKITE